MPDAATQLRQLPLQPAQWVKPMRWALRYITYPIGAKRPAIRKMPTGAVKVHLAACWAGRAFEPHHSSEQRGFSCARPANHGKPLRSCDLQANVMQNTPPTNFGGQSIDFQQRNPVTRQPSDPASPDMFRPGECGSPPLCHCPRKPVSCGRVGSGEGPHLGWPGSVHRSAGVLQ